MLKKYIAVYLAALTAGMSTPGDKMSDCSCWWNMLYPSFYNCDGEVRLKIVEIIEKASQGQDAYIDLKVVANYLSINSGLKNL